MNDKVIILNVSELKVCKKYIEIIKLHITSVYRN